MDGIPYSIERTTNKNSRATLRDGRILIRLARNLPRLEEMRHIDTLLRRMTKAFVREKHTTRIDPFRGLLRGEKIVHLTLVTGSVVSFHVHDGKRTKALHISGGWSVIRGVATNDETFQKFLWKLLASSERENIDKLVCSINAETFGVPIAKVTMKCMRSRWGSCSRSGVIALSTPLLLTTPEILRYVIIHELAHRIRQDHSPAFWREVVSYSPDYREHVKNLRNFTLPRRMREKS